MTRHRSSSTAGVLVALLLTGSACTLLLPMPWGRQVVDTALGWTETLGGIPLEHGRCQVDPESDAALRCEFDAMSCDVGCGPELSAFTSRVDAHNSALARGGGQHIYGWTLELQGRIAIDWSEPWEFSAGRVEVDCQRAMFFTQGHVPTVPGVPMIPGQLAYSHHELARLHPGDIVVGPGGWQAPIRAVCTEGNPCSDGAGNAVANEFRLGWPWPGPATDETYISTGVAVRQSGNGVSFRTACPIYDRTRWTRGLRQKPASVIRTPGWDTEDGWCTYNFEHPGDYLHVNVSRSSGGGTNGVRYTGCVHQSHRVVTQHAELLRDGYPAEGIGAGFLLLANTVKVEPRQLMNAATRCFLVVAGHRIELEGVCEGPVQMLWAPTGVSSLLLTGAMNHQNSPAAPRDLPWIDLGTRSGRNPSAVDIRFPFIFFQWGQGNRRHTLIRARGNPLYLHIEAAVKNVGRILDVPDGSFVSGHVACLDRPAYDCGVLGTND
jgi:hypothetical protein